VALAAALAEAPDEDRADGMAVVCVPPGLPLEPDLAARPLSPGPPESSEEARSESQDGMLPSDPVAAVEPPRPEPAGPAPVPAPEPSSAQAATAVISSIEPAVAATAVERLRRRMRRCYEHRLRMAIAERPGPPSLQYAGTWRRLAGGAASGDLPMAIPPPAARLVEANLAIHLEVER
jgi:hypothetical protein